MLFFIGLTVTLSLCFVSYPGAREGRVRGSADPIKFGAEVKNCIAFKGWGANQRIMLRDKTRFLP